MKIKRKHIGHLVINLRYPEHIWKVEAVTADGNQFVGEGQFWPVLGCSRPQKIFQNDLFWIIAD